MVAAKFLDDQNRPEVGFPTAARCRSFRYRRTARYFADWALDRVSGFVGRVESDLIVRTYAGLWASDSGRIAVARGVETRWGKTKHPPGSAGINVADRCGSCTCRGARLRVQPVQSCFSGPAAADRRSNCLFILRHLKRHAPTGSVDRRATENQQMATAELRRRL